MHGPSISVAGGLIDVLEVRLKVSAGSTAQFYWTNNEGGMAEARSQAFSIAADSQWHTYYVDLSSHSEWKGTTITLLRFDPTNTSGASIEVDYIRGAYVSQIDYQFDASADGWSNTHDLTSFSVSGGILSTTATGGDPFMEGPSFSLNGSDEDKLYVRMKVSAGSAAQFFWRNNDGSWSPARSTTFSITPGSDYRVYQVDMSSHAHWAGKTIYQLRLDPTTVSGATIDIDYISGRPPTS